LKTRLSLSDRPFKGGQAVHLVTLGVFRLDPLKNLNAIGDGGFVSTNDHAPSTRLRRLRNHGMINRETVTEFGFVSRMDTLQAAVLRYRLARLPGLIAKRRRNAAAYRQILDRRHIYVPPSGLTPSTPTTPLSLRPTNGTTLKAFLADEGIGTAIHYPAPIHLQPAAASLGHSYGLP